LDQAGARVYALATSGQRLDLAKAGEGVISNANHGSFLPPSWVSSISNTAHAQHLPPSWDSLYQLSRLDEGTLTAAE
jgi:hypothetical protein